MGLLLTPQDDYIREPGPESNWNESRYIDFYDPVQKVGGWFRLGNRVNEGHAEVSVCVNLPDGSAAVRFKRPEITRNGDEAGGMRWSVVRPFEEGVMEFVGRVSILKDPRALVDPKAALAGAPEAECRIRLTSHGEGLPSVLGKDQDHIDKIFLPGQAHGHFQHLVRTRGTITIGEKAWEVNGVGGRDHSWGPRNWLSKLYFRWLIALFDDGFGFMVTRALGPTASKRGGFVWEEGQFHLLDTMEVESDYSEAGFYHLACRTSFRSGNREWRASGTALGHVPLRHRQKAPDGSQSLLRIVKSPTRWTLPDGRVGYGMTEYHDQFVDGKPMGLGI